MMSGFVLAISLLGWVVTSVGTAFLAESQKKRGDSPMRTCWIGLAISAGLCITCMFMFNDHSAWFYNHLVTQSIVTVAGMVGLGMAFALISFMHES